MNCALGSARGAERGHAGGTHAVVDVGVSDPAEVLDACCDRCRAAKEHEGLVDRVRREVVREAARGGRHVLPRALENRAVTVETTENNSKNV